MHSLIFFLALLIFQPSAQTTKIDGTWKLTVETSAGSGNPTMVLKQQNDTEFSGTYSGRLGEMPVKGKKDGNKFTITFEAQGVEVEYQGTLEGDTMQGNVKLGSMGEGKFKGTREKA